MCERTVLTKVTDTMDDLAVQAMVAAVADGLGGVDILVNSAAQPGGDGTRTGGPVAPVIRAIGKNAGGRGRQAEFHPAEQIMRLPRTPGYTFRVLLT
jgi:NAD(P)-dependent dehydrogenase (short-subunit alcohol dehydrogenase family)